MAPNAWLRAIYCTLTTVVVGLAGCQSWNPWGEGFKGSMADWSSGLRQERDGEGLGLSAKSREIERNLGYR